MENLSKIISLVAGIFIVIIIFVILQNRYNLRGRISWLGGSSTRQIATVIPSPTPSKSESTPQKTSVLKTIEKIQPTPQKTAKQPVFTKGGQNVKSIPSTGAPTLLIPLAFSALGGGLYLRKRK